MLAKIMIRVLGMASSGDQSLLFVRVAGCSPMAMLVCSDTVLIEKWSVASVGTWNWLMGVLSSAVRRRYARDRLGIAECCAEGTGQGAQSGRRDCLIVLGLIEVVAEVPQ